MYFELSIDTNVISIFNIWILQIRSRYCKSEDGVNILIWDFQKQCVFKYETYVSLFLKNICDTTYVKLFFKHSVCLTHLKCIYHIHGNTFYFFPCVYINIFGHPYEIQSLFVSINLYV